MVSYCSAMVVHFIYCIQLEYFILNEGEKIPLVMKLKIDLREKWSDQTNTAKI